MIQIVAIQLIIMEFTGVMTVGFFSWGASALHF